jgi:ABC-type multidrug transport system ATPase subunit
MERTDISFSDMAQEAAPPPEPLLDVSGITKRYGDQLALADVAFAARTGEVLGLIGPNGAGKTTLLESVAGVLPVDAGRMLWRGGPLPLAQRRRVMFYLPDGVRPWQDHHVVRLLGWFGGIYRRSPGEIADCVATAGLEPVLRKRAGALSKGYGRRLMWALALLAPHPLLLMDEPFDGFDLRQTREMISVLRRVVARGRTLILSIHQLADAERACDRFVLLAGGRVCGVGTLDELRAHTRRPDAPLEEVFLALT